MNKIAIQKCEIKFYTLKKKQTHAPGRVFDHPPPGSMRPCESRGGIRIVMVSVFF